jgi:hydrogenase nickel incorporation protein HypA/HybF
MHEQGLINDLMPRIARAARTEEADRVVAVSAWFGALSHMSPDHFREHFDLTSAGSLAEGARLAITTPDDIHDCAAADVLLEGVEVETGRR